jgi:hypothetical protein
MLAFTVVVPVKAVPLPSAAVFHPAKTNPSLPGDRGRVSTVTAGLVTVREPGIAGLSPPLPSKLMI